MHMKRFLSAFAARLPLRGNAVFNGQRRCAYKHGTSLHRSADLTCKGLQRLITSCISLSFPLPTSAAHPRRGRAACSSNLTCIRASEGVPSIDQAACSKQSSCIRSIGLPGERLHSASLCFGQQVLRLRFMLIIMFLREIPRGIEGAV